MSLSITYLDFDDIKNPLLGAGQAKATFEVCSRLAKKGHKIKVICSKYPGFKDRTEKGIYYKHIGLGSKNIRLNNLVYIFVLPYYVKGLKCDVIAECFTAPITTLFSPLFTKIPVVALSTSFEAERFAKLYHLPFDKIEKFGLRFYKYFLPSTPFFDEKMKAVNKNIISKVVLLGADKHYSTLKPAKSLKHILFLGRLDIDQKGLDLLIEAYEKISDKTIFPLIIAGHGPDEQKIKDLIHKKNLDSKIKLVGPAYGKEKDILLSQAIAFVVPSRNEGFCIAAGEALAAGVPVVSFDIPGLSWIDNTVSLKASGFDSQDFSNKILAVIEPKTNSNIRHNTRIFAQRLSWEKTAEEYEKFFQMMKNKFK